ncbi:MAG: hypothetical protein ACTTID_03675 [Bacillales bacterium]
MLKIFSVVGFLCLSSLGSYNKQSVDTTFGYKETRYFLRNSNYSRNGIYIECKIHTDNKLLSGDDSVSFELLTNHV